MILKSIDGAEFELVILSYQFPDIPDDPYSSNWLNIRVIVRSSDAEDNIYFDLKSTSPEVTVLEIRCRFYRLISDHLSTFRAKWDFQVTPEHLREVTEEWYNELQQYPTRAKRKRIQRKKD